MTPNNTSLKETFDNTVRHFHAVIQSQQETIDRNSIIDAANDVFLARDAYAEKMPVNTPEWAGISHDIDDINTILENRDIVMNSVPQETATGQKTYRILNNPSRVM